MIEAMMDAWTDRSIGAVILTGAGDRAFCTGGDQSIRSKDGYAIEENGEGFQGLSKLPCPTIIHCCCRPLEQCQNP